MAESTSLKLEMIEEFRLTDKLRSQLRNLLHKNFPEFFETHVYTKQVATFRVLVWKETDLIAQIAIDHRVVSIDGKPASIFGIVDLCVSESQRSNGIAKNLLEYVENLAKGHNIDYLILFADDHRVYNRFGFQLCNCSCRWTGIHEHKTIGVLNEELGDCLMVKPLEDKKIPIKSLDLLGYLF